MRFRILSIATLVLLPLVSCSGGKLDTAQLGTMVGGKTGQRITAIGHGANALTLNEKDEDDIGQAVGVSLTNTYPVLHNDALTKYVTLVGYTVASTSPRPDMHYVFGILDTPEVNAFSGPHGYIFITRGTLATLKDEAELAGILGHEMSHVLLHHGLAQLKTAEAKAALSEGVQTVHGASKFSALADLGVDAITKVGYTQQQEFDADANSVKLMAASGYNPASYLNFLTRLAAIQVPGGPVMSTHPGGPERVKRVATQLQTVPQTGATLADRFALNVKM